MSQIVLVRATGFGATALRSGEILHFDAAEAKQKNPNKRKLEALVDIEDARKIRDLGWGDFDDPEDDDGDEAAGEVDLEALAAKLNATGKAPRQAKAKAAKAKTAKAKAAAPNTAPAPVAAPAAEPAGDGEATAPAGAAGDPNDPEAGPA